MKKGLFSKLLIAGFIIAILYIFIGQDFLRFYTGGREELLRTATLINERCNEDGACPATLDGWSARGTMLAKGNMLYMLSPRTQRPDEAKPEERQNFKLVYSFFMPDNWFEASGGVGEKVVMGWKER